MWLHPAHKGAVKNGDIHIGFCLNPFFSPGVLPHLSHVSWRQRQAVKTDSLTHCLLLTRRKADAYLLLVSSLTWDQNTSVHLDSGLTRRRNKVVSVFRRPAEWGWGRTDSREGGSDELSNREDTAGGVVPSVLLYVSRSACQALKTTSGTCGCGVKQTQENTGTPLSLVWGPWWVVHTQQAVYIQHDAQLCTLTQVFTALVACWGFCVVWSVCACVCTKPSFQR